MSGYEGEWPPKPPDPSASPTMSYKDAVKEKTSCDKNSEWLSRMFKIASRPWKTKSDDELRKMVKGEEEALAAWVMGALVLDSPPGFLECTHSYDHRLMYTKFFEEHLEGVVVAVVPPHVRISPLVAETTLLMQLLSSEQAGTAAHQTVCSLIECSKRLHYNGATRRLTIVVKERAIADKWRRISVRLHGEQLLLLSASKLEEEDDQMDVNNCVPKRRTHRSSHLRGRDRGSDVDPMRHSACQQDVSYQRFEVRRIRSPSRYRHRAEC